MPKHTAPLLLLLAAALLPPGAAAAAEGPEGFQQCVRELRDDLRAEGYAPQAIAATLGEVQFRERIVELDRAQPESLQHFSEYLEARVTPERIEQGRRMYRKHEGLLWRLHDEYGVSPRYLVALWGMETAYGAYFGRMPVVDAVVTLVCDGRREAFFRRQLEATVALVGEGRLQPGELYGSWAGAMGHTQFMPTTLRDHAVDYDGSGSVDLRGSVPDALASAASYLEAMGWQRGERWGREVTLAEGFELGRFGLDETRTVAEWARAGVRRADGTALPDSGIEAALLLPMGIGGPAFLVYENFRKILRWNPSVSYAVAVGVLADRIDGQPPLRTPAPPEASLLERDEVRAVQRRLNERGYDSGKVDGLIGPNTRSAVRAFQRERGLPPDGYPDRALLERLGASRAAAE